MRWLIRILFTLAVLAVAAVAALFLIPSEKVAAILSRQIEAATGQKMTIGDGVHATLWPEPGVRLGNVTLNGTGGVPLLTARTLDVAVNAQALWGGSVRVTRVDLTDPVITLVRAEDGTANWEGLQGHADGGAPQAAPPAPGGADPAAAAPSLGSLTLDRGTIRNATVRFTDEAAGTAWEAQGVDLTLTLPEAGGPADMEFAATVGETALAGTARTGALADALSGGVAPFSFALSAGQSHVTFDGRAGFAPVSAEGRVEADLTDPAGSARLFGVAMPDLPPGLGRSKASVTGQMTWTAEQSLHLRDGTVALDDNRLAGAFDLTTDGDRPMLTARLKADALVLPEGRAAAGGDGSGGAATAGPGGWSTERIDAGGLGVMDAKLRLDAGSLSAGGRTVAPLSLSLTIDRARAVADIGKAGLFGGGVTGRIVVNNRKGLSVATDLAATGIDLRAVLTALAGSDRAGGTASGHLRTLGAGQSVAQIMAGLSGSGDLAVTGGDIRGVDLARALRAYDPTAIDAAAVTPFDSLTGSFAIAGGVLTNPDLVLSAAAASATGLGTLNLGQRTVDYRLTPVALTGEHGHELAVPLHITGPWSGPKIAPDLDELAKLRFKAQLEAEKAKAEQKLGEQLGLDQQPGEGLDDAAKRKLQEEALKGLGKLLGGN